MEVSELLNALLSKHQEIQSTRGQIIDIRQKRRELAERLVTPGRPKSLAEVIDQLNQAVPIDPQLASRLEGLQAERKELAFKLVKAISEELGFDPPWGPFKVGVHTVACDTRMPSGLMVDGAYILVD